MQSSIIPQIKIISEKEYQGIYELEPLEKTFGMTIGNALRRVLLSSLPGVAVTAVRVQGVSQEFRALPSMKEDILDFVLNVKELKIRKLQDFEGPLNLTIDVKGKKTITASDINCPSQVEIVNKDLYLASLVDEKQHFESDLVVEEGRGYVPVSERSNVEKNKSIDYIAVDALFTPIEEVNYRVEPTRVGQYTDFDKVIFDITTNGTLSPLRAINLSAAILVEHFSLLVDEKYFKPSLNEIQEIATQEIQEEDEQLVENEAGSDVTIEDLGLSTRVLNSLHTEGIDTVNKLLRYSYDDIMKLKNFGLKSMTELQERLQENDFPEIK